MAKEYDIPDFTGYTIDENKKVYSYKKGKKKELSICIKEGTSVVAMTNNNGERKHLSVPRVYYFASRGISPDSSQAKQMVIFQDGTVVDKKNYMEVVLRFKMESLGMKKDRIAADTQKKIDYRFKLLKFAIDLQYEAIEKNNGTKLFNFLIGQLDNALIHINRYTKIRKQQIKDAWTDACIQETRKVLSNHFIIGDIVRTTIKVAAHLRRKEIDKSSRTLNIIDNYNYETASR